MKWPRLSILVLLSAMAVAPGLAQAPVAAAVPAFDVISVKPDKTGSSMTRLMMTPDGFNADNVLVHMMLLEGYQLNQDQLVGEPGWTTTDRFDIQAKVAGQEIAAFTKLTFNQRRTMFRQILVEQFKLTAHMETRQLPVYVLTVAKGGTKIDKHVPDPEHPEREKNGQGWFMAGPDKIETKGTTMAYFLSFLTQDVKRTIVDKTNLTGTYDIKLHWTPDDVAAAAPQTVVDGTQPTAAADSGPSIFTAIEEQLGLKLESAKGAVEVLVIDHIEKPAGD